MDGNFTMKQSDQSQNVKSSQGVTLPEVNFSTFLVSLSSSALVNLGEIEEPGTNQKQKNIQLAKHCIDVIAMLQVKTKGNLTNEENQLIQNILTELRMKYIKESK